MDLHNVFVTNQQSLRPFYIVIVELSKSSHDVL